MKKISIVLIVVILLMFIIIGITSCSTSNPILEDAKWFLTSYRMQDKLEGLIEDTEITATFNSTEGEVSGSAGCNTYWAVYEVKGGELSIFDMSFTEMACISPEGVMEQEQVFLSLLAKAQSFEANDATLTIFCSGGQQLYFTTDIRQ